MSEPDYYAILGVDPGAAPEEIKRAFRRLTLEHHPDRHGSDPAVEERYRQINAAYAVLSDPVLRGRYDTQRRLAMLDLSRAAQGQSTRDLLSNVFGDVFGSKRAERRRGRDLRYTLTVEFAEAILGATKTISFEAPGPCAACRGSGTRSGGRSADACPMCHGKGEIKGEGLFGRRTRCGRCDGTGLRQRDPCDKCRGRGTMRQMRSFEVRLPAGTKPGSERVIKGQGEPGRFDGDSGDLRVTVNVRPHPRLQRQGNDVRVEVSISLTEAALGTRVEVPTVHGDVTVDVPAGVRSGTRLRLRQKGVPAGMSGSKGGRPAGDQLVIVTIETPKLDDQGRIRALLEQLEEACIEAGSLPTRARERGQSPV